MEEPMIRPVAENEVVTDFYDICSQVGVWENSKEGDKDLTLVAAILTLASEIKRLGMELTHKS